MNPTTIGRSPRIALAGSGYWGRNLLRNFNDLGVLRAVCDRDPDRLAGVGECCPDLDRCSDYADLLRREDIDGIAIATPAETHYSLASEAVAAGKHVFVEKPLSLRVEQGRDLVRRAEEMGVVLMVGHILHYHAAVMRLKALVDAGELGKIQYLYSNRLNIGKIRNEENILWSFAPHDISVILMLLGEMPETVNATGGSYLQERIPDTTLTAMDFPSGVKAHIFVSWLHPFKEQKLVVVGDRKMAVFDDVAAEKLRLYPHRIHWRERVPVADRAPAEVVRVEEGEPLREECSHFLRCIEQGLRPATDGREGLRVLQVLESCQASLNDRGRKVRLSAGRQAPSAPMEIAAESVFVHDSSYVDEDVVVGGGTRVWHFSHLLSGSRIGRNCRIGQNVSIGPDVTIGDGCKIQNNVSVYKGVRLEDSVFCGPSMVFTNVINPRSAVGRMAELKPTLVRKGASIGANATVRCGVTIGRYAFVGAGAVVLEDVADHAVVAGNPARIKGWMCACGVGLDETLVCPACGKRFRRGGTGLCEGEDRGDGEAELGPDAPIAVRSPLLREEEALMAREEG